MCFSWIIADFIVHVVVYAHYILTCITKLVSFTCIRICTRRFVMIRQPLNRLFRYYSLHSLLFIVRARSSWNGRVKRSFHVGVDKRIIPHTVRRRTLCTLYYAVVCTFSPRKLLQLLLRNRRLWFFFFLRRPDNFYCNLQSYYTSDVEYVLCIRLLLFLDVTRDFYDSFKEFLNSRTIQSDSMQIRTTWVEMDTRSVSNRRRSVSVHLIIVFSDRPKNLYIKQLLR